MKIFSAHRNREVLLLTTAFSLSQGVLGVWLSVMNMMIEMNANLEPLGLNQVPNCPDIYFHSDLHKLVQVQSGWLGFWAIVASCVLALVIARLTDYLAGYMKETITVLLIVSSIAFTILAMMCLAMIEPSLYRKIDHII